MTWTFQRLTALVLSGSLSLSACAVDVTSTASQHATAMTEPTEPVCQDDPDAKLKRKLELRKSTLTDLIAAAESDIRTNEHTIATNSGTIAAATEFLTHINDGLNYPQTDPAQESFVGRKHLVDAIDDVGKFPASAIGKFGLFVLVAALEAFTLRAAGKAVAKRLCAQSVVRAAEKAALTEAAKKASMKSVSMLKKFWTKFGKAKLVVGGVGAIALPMKARWEIKGDSWETWVPVVGTLKIGGENLGQEFTAWNNRDEIKKALEASLAEMDAEIKKVQAIIKEKTDENLKLTKENIKLTDDMKKWKTELAKVEAALAQLGGGNVCMLCDPDGEELFLVATETPALDHDATVPSDEPASDELAAEVPSDEPASDELASDEPADEDFSGWSLDELLAGIDLSDAATTQAEIVILDHFELCDGEGVCTPL